MIFAIVRIRDHILKKIERHRKSRGNRMKVTGKPLENCSGITQESLRNHSGITQESLRNHSGSAQDCSGLLRNVQESLRIVQESWGVSIEHCALNILLPPTYAPPRVFSALVQIARRRRKVLTAKALRVAARCVGGC
jgi:hypothetical protein